MNLRNFKETFGFNNAQVGYRLGLSHSSICRILNGDRTLQQKNVERLKVMVGFEEIIACDPLDVLLVKKEQLEIIRGY